MWLSLSNGFLSVVDKANDPSCLLVRSRRKQDLQQYFPKAKIVKTVGNDYLFRAEVKREEVAKVVADYVMGISYDNFKDSVRDNQLHSAYSGVWSVMARIQPIEPYGSRNSRQRSLF